VSPMLWVKWAMTLPAGSPELAVVWDRACEAGRTYKDHVIVPILWVGIDDPEPWKKQNDKKFRESAVSLSMGCFIDDPSYPRSVLCGRRERRFPL
jgi:hypothetical protein